VTQVKPEEVYPLNVTEVADEVVELVKMRAHRLAANSRTYVPKHVVVHDILVEVASIINNEE